MDDERQWWSESYSVGSGHTLFHEGDAEPPMMQFRSVSAAAARAYAKRPQPVAPQRQPFGFRRG